VDIKYTNIFPLQDHPEFSQIGISGLKTNHPASLLVAALFCYLLILIFVLDSMQLRTCVRRLSNAQSIVNKCIEKAFLQGDQIGRIFAYWAIVFFGRFL
jgi:hypothetical protein